jgi:hypothetical protein
MMMFDYGAKPVNNMSGLPHDYTWLWKENLKVLGTSWRNCSAQMFWCHFLHHKNIGTGQQGRL